MGKICGNDISPNTTFASTGNQMLVVMKTDFSQELKGFMAHFVTACGSNLLVKESGLINAKNMGEWSTPHCNWTFTTETQGWIKCSINCNYLIYYLLPFKQTNTFN